MQWAILILLLPVGLLAFYKALEAFELVAPGEVWREEKRREKRWKALQKELEEQEEQEEKEQ